MAIAPVPCEDLPGIKMITMVATLLPPKSFHKMFLVAILTQNYAKMGIWGNVSSSQADIIQTQRNWIVFLAPTCHPPSCLHLSSLLLDRQGREQEDRGRKGTEKKEGQGVLPKVTETRRKRKSPLVSCNTTK